MVLSILILMQINASQYVLIRIPNNMGLFNEKSLSARVGAGIRTNLLREETDREIANLE